VALDDTVEVLREAAALEPHARRWREQAERLGNPFVTPDWYLAWLRHMGEGARPRVVVVRSADGAVRGLMPLVAELRGRRRVLRFAGADVGDCFHPVAAEPDQAAVAGRAAEALGDCSALVLDRAGPGTDWARALADGLPRHARVDYREAPLPCLALGEGGWDAYLASRSRNFRNQVGRKMRVLERSHEVNLRMTTAGDDLDADFDTFLRLHRERWRERGGSQALRDDADGFHREFARAAREHGWLRLWFLEVDGEPAAAWYGWHIGGRYAYYLAGFSPRWAGSSVGFLLLAHTVRSAFEEGAASYDFLLGAETYKSRFSDGQREVRTIALGRRGPAFMQLRAEAELWRFGSRLPPEARTRAIAAYRRVSVSGRR
jgi:CelD/BcsL family acetyltransferase involved in cellulose biosynthesis